MDWKAQAFDWNRARAFLVTAEEGSFSAAARALGASQPTLGRQVAALEAELGVALFERVGTRLELTVAGTDLLEHVRAMGDAANRVSLAATGQAASIEGTVAITASEAISGYLLPPILRCLREEHPGIEIEIVASNEARDLQRREADIAIRNFKPTTPDLIALKVRDMDACFFATPSYLARVGPLTAKSHGAAEFFAFDRSEQMMSGLAALGLHLDRRQFPILAPNHLVQWELCKAGVGICMMMEEVGRAEPTVERVLPEFAISLPIWLVCHRELRTSRRIRLVFDTLAALLKPSADQPKSTP